MSPKDTDRNTFRTQDGLVFPRRSKILDERRIRRLRRGEYERKELAALHRLVKPSDRILELGGGIGVISTYAGVVKNVSAITVVEANPHLVEFIKEAHSLNGVDQATVLHGAVTPSGGEPLEFHLRDDFVAASLSAEVGGVTETILVPAIAINDLLEQATPSVLICDIEGAEVEILQSADLSTVRLIIVETHPQWIGQTGMRTIFDACHDAGLIYYHKGSEGKVLCFRRDW